MEQNVNDYVQNPNSETSVVANDGERTIDLGRVFRTIWHFIWVVAIATVLCGLLAFGYTKLFIPKQYESSFSVYARNSAGQGAVSSDELAGMTVEPLLTELDTLTAIAEKMGGGYTGEMLKQIVSTNIDSEYNSKIIIRATHTDPTVAYQVARAMYDYLPEHVSEWSNKKQEIKPYGSPLQAELASPNVIKNTLIGAAAGFLASCIVLAIIELCNNNIYMDEYLIETYHLPVLANIPDFCSDTKSKRHRYYRYGYGKSHYGYGTQSK